MSFKIQLKIKTWIYGQELSLKIWKYLFLENIQFDVRNPDISIIIWNRLISRVEGWWGGVGWGNCYYCALVYCNLIQEASAQYYTFSCNWSVGISFSNRCKAKFMVCWSMAILILTEFSSKLPGLWLSSKYSYWNVSALSVFLFLR